MKPIAHFGPLVMCGFISLMALIGTAISGKPDWWQPAFFSFLPMCFFFIGTTTLSLQRQLAELWRDVDAFKRIGTSDFNCDHQIQELQRRLTDLEQKQFA